MNKLDKEIYMSNNDWKKLKIVFDYLLETWEIEYKEYIKKEFKEFLNDCTSNLSIKEFYKNLNSGHIYETILELSDNIFPKNDSNDIYEEENFAGCQRKEIHYECYGVLWQCSKCKIIICCAEGTDTGNKQLDSLCDECWAIQTNI